MPPFVPLARLVAEYVASKGDYEGAKEFVTTRLARPWMERSKAPEWRRL